MVPLARVCRATWARRRRRRRRLPEDPAVRRLLDASPKSARLLPQRGRRLERRAARALQGLLILAEAEARPADLEGGLRPVFPQRQRPLRLRERGAVPLLAKQRGRAAAQQLGRPLFRPSFVLRNLRDATAVARVAGADGRISITDAATGAACYEATLGYAP